MRRYKSEIDFQSDIDEFIHLALRWNTLHKRLLNTLRDCLKKSTNSHYKTSLSTQAKAKPYK